MPKDKKTQLTDSAIDKAIKLYAETKVRTTLTDPETPGLNIRPAQQGAEWSFRLRDQTGAQRRFSLGQYPTIKIKKAREAAGILRYQVRIEGADPHANKAAKKAAAKNPPPAALTLQGLIDLYAKEMGPVRKSWRIPEPGERNKAKLGDGKRRIESVFANALWTDVKKLKRADLLKLVGAWPSRSSAAAAVRYIKPLLKWAEDRDYVAQELTALRQPVGGVRRGSRCLNDDELARLLVTLRDHKNWQAPSQFANAMRLILLTAVRRDEAGEAKWGEIQGGLWIIPGERIKNTKPDQRRDNFIVPLPRQARELLAAIKPATAAADDFIFSHRLGLPLSQWDKPTKRIQEISGVTGWHRHDLRRTAATSMGNLGISPAVVDAALNHANIHSRLAGVYNLSRYTKEVGEALQKLADWYDEIEQRARNRSGKNEAG